jgi:FKBP-type peptidyl-prolyl cis-trans isomerase
MRLPALPLLMLLVTLPVGCGSEEGRMLAELNREEGERFLAENARRPEVRVLRSGLQVELLAQGTGARPQPEDYVTVHYEGRLIDGRIFDSTRVRGEPATLKLANVIPGWREALAHLQEGARARLFVPAELAYGDRRVGPVIGPNSTLVFDVELLAVASDRP